AGVVGRPQADGDLLQRGIGPRPVRDVAADVAVGREDVHEDVLRPPPAGQLGVVVDVLVVAGGDGAGHDGGRRDGDVEHGELVALVHLGIRQGSHTGANNGSVSSSSTLTKRTSTGMPMVTSPGSMSMTFEMSRVPSSNAITATT